ncbi:unnamed protein product, partial [marine sediment metagenome]
GHHFGRDRDATSKYENISVVDQPLERLDIGTESTDDIVLLAKAVNRDGVNRASNKNIHRFKALSSGPSVSFGSKKCGQVSVLSVRFKS